jgi:hypothetical protein
LSIEKIYIYLKVSLAFLNLAHSDVVTINSSLDTSIMLFGLCSYQNHEPNKFFFVPGLRYFAVAAQNGLRQLVWK